MKLSPSYMRAFEPAEVVRGNFLDWVMMMLRKVGVKDRILSGVKSRCKALWQEGEYKV